MEKGSLLVSPHILHLQFVLPALQKLTRVLRPKEFPKVSSYEEDSDEEESVVGKMPPSDESDVED